MGNVLIELLRTITLIGSLSPVHSKVRRNILKSRGCWDPITIPSPKNNDIVTCNFANGYLGSAMKTPCETYCKALHK